MAKHIEQTPEEKKSKRKRKKEMQSTLQFLPSACDSILPPPNEVSRKKKKKKYTNCNAAPEIGSIPTHSTLADGIPKNRTKRKQPDANTGLQLQLDHLGTEQPLWSTLAKELAKLYALNNEQSGKELLPLRLRKQSPKCATRLRNWTLAMKRNSREEDIRKALEPFTIKRDCTHEVGLSPLPCRTCYAANTLTTPIFLQAFVMLKGHGVCIIEDFFDEDESTPNPDSPPALFACDSKQAKYILQKGTPPNTPFQQCPTNFKNLCLQNHSARG